MRKFTQTFKNGKRHARNTLREQNRQRTQGGLGKRMQTARYVGGTELSYPWKFSFKLLGMQLDCQWSFDEHINGLQTGEVERLSVPRRAANCTRG